MRIASVTVDVAARALDHAFDYAVPSQLADVEVGCAVTVELGSRPVVGFVTALRDEGGAGDAGGGADGGREGDGGSGGNEGRAGDSGRGLKSLLGVLSEPYFDEVASRLMMWIAHEYVCPLSDALRLFTPPGGSPKMKRKDGAWTLVHPGVGAVDDRWVSLVAGSEGFAPAKNATRQRAVIDALAAGPVRVAELALEVGGLNATLKALEKKGVVTVEHRRRIRDARPAPAPDTPGLVLTDGQRNALGAIRAARIGGGGVVVCDGVTGSGKTEVYLRAIADVLAEGHGAIVLVPEISLTPQTVGRFRARFGDDVAVLHSRLSAGERFDQWDLVRTGAAHVVVGTRSALFAPLVDVGLIVIDEEHDDSYKQDSSPRYAAREVAERLASLRGAVLVLGSATPAITTLAACGAGGTLGAEGGPGDADSPVESPDLSAARPQHNAAPLQHNGPTVTQSPRASSLPWTHVSLPERATKSALPPVEVVDMAAEFKGGSRSMFSGALTTALAECLERGEKAVLMLNRRGFASFLLCRECGFVPECPNCAVSLTCHERGMRLSCHHCDHSEEVPARCPKCGSPYLRKFGTGTERVEDELRALIGEEAPIVRMDADTVRVAGKNAHEKLLGQFAAAESGVLLGTQMIAKGLDFADVTLVGVINADTTLKLPDYRAAERTWQLLEQVSGRAGRAERLGRVIAQTYMPTHPAILAAATHDRAGFVAGELEEREELGYPPFTRLANVLVWGARERDVKDEAVRLALALDSAVSSAGLDWALLGPSPCLISRLRGQYRWHILVKAAPHDDIGALLAPVLAARRPRPADVRVAADVDPADLF